LPQPSAYGWNSSRRSRARARAWASAPALPALQPAGALGQLVRARFRRSRNVSDASHHARAQPSFGVVSRPPAAWLRPGYVHPLAPRSPVQTRSRSAGKPREDRRPPRLPSGSPSAGTGEGGVSTNPVSPAVPAAFGSSRVGRRGRTSPGPPLTRTDRAPRPSRRRLSRRPPYARPAPPASKDLLLRADESDRCIVVLELLSHALKKPKYPHQVLTLEERQARRANSSASLAAATSLPALQPARPLGHCTWGSSRALESRRTSPTGHDPERST
jgi:hypothetical protein